MHLALLEIIAEHVTWSQKFTKAPVGYDFGAIGVSVYIIGISIVWSTRASSFHFMISNMHSLFNRKYKKIVKIDRYVTVKRFDHTNEKGQHLFGIKQSNVLFYSDEMNPTVAFMKYSQCTQYMIIDSVRISRGEKRLCNENTGERDKWMYFYTIEGETDTFTTLSPNIHHAFVEWKLQKLFQSMLHLTQVS